MKSMMTPMANQHPTGILGQGVVRNTLSGYLILAWLMILFVGLSLVPQVSQAASLTVGPPYSAVASKRISSTQLEATMKATIQNPGTTGYADVTASLKVLSSRVVVVDGNLSFGAVAAGATVTSRDTFTVRLNTSMPVEPDEFVWTVTTRTVPVLANIPSQTITANSTLTLPLSATDADGDALTYSVAPALPNASINATSGVFTFTPTQAQIGTHTLTFTVSDGRYSATKTATIKVEAPPYGALPPDPATVAPALAKSAITPFTDAIGFLYTGANPIQTGVVPGTIKPERAAVIRGRVLDSTNQPLAGVKVSIQGEAKLGSTLTRQDGMFDLVVNGGGNLTINYELAGRLPAQRQVNTRWNDYYWADDVVLLTLDPITNPINLTQPTLQVARGSVVTDADGSRQAAILFPAGTQAQMVMPDGSTRSLSQMTVRATEYTVGTSGPQAMPGPLPPSSGYTYAVELSVDEAIAAGAKSVRFSQPVYSYVDNFLNFPVGGIVPAGYYDRDKAAWIPSDNGRIIKILTVNNGLAEIDVNGSGQPASATQLASLNVTAEERTRLAGMYPVGKSLWRVPVTHFTPWDYNWPFGPPRTARPPNPPKPPKVEKKEPKPDCQGGSIIECQNQTLGESVPITGTPFSLNYRSNRVEGHSSRYIDIALTGSDVPASLKRIDVEILVAGQRILRSYPATPNQSTNYTWDGRDSYGRVVRAPQPATVRIGYVYDAVYQQPAEFAQSFAQLSGVPWEGSRGRQEVVLWQESTVDVGGWDARVQGLGGWTLDAQHRFHAGINTLHFGDGASQSAADIGLTSSIAAGNGEFWLGGGDGGQANETAIGWPTSLAVAPDGSLYIGGSETIRRVDPNGIITTIAGNGRQCYPYTPSEFAACGDGGPALQAKISSPESMAFDAAGNLYVTDSFLGSTGRIRRIGRDGIVTTVVGSGEFCGWFCSSAELGDGGAATSARLGGANGIAVAPDGTLYIAQSFYSRIRKVDSSGIITTVAGNGQRGFSGDGGLATSARLSYPKNVTVGPEGAIYFIDSGNHRIRKISADGIITTVAGTGVPLISDDGGPATEASLAYPSHIVASANGTLYFTDSSSHRLRKITPQGIIDTIAGKGVSAQEAYPDVDGNPFTNRFTKEMLGVGASARMLLLTYPSMLAIGPSGEIYVNGQTGFVLKISSALGQSYPGGQAWVASPDGTELHQFDGAGRHLSTLDTRTRQARYQFGYDTAGYLTTITDLDNNTTRIERNGATPTAIVAPDGQRTTLTVDANGYLSAIRNPAGETHTISYNTGGLLQTFTDPRGHTTRMTYDSLGRLIGNDNAAGGGWRLSRTDDASGYDVSMTSALGRKTSYRIENPTNGDQRRTTFHPDGTQTRTLIGANGSETVTEPDGTVLQTTYGPDPRFGMQAPLAAQVNITLPSGLTNTSTTTRTVTLADSKDLLSLTTEQTTTTINGRAYQSIYDAASRTLTRLTPALRQVMTTLDSQDRVASVQQPGIAPWGYSYDSRGRLIAQTQGTGTTLRTSRLSYNTQGLPATATDALGRVTQYQYDLVGRVTRQTLPGGRVIDYSYDANGNLTSLTPPGRPAHRYHYDAADQTSAYLPPAIPNGGDTHYSYNVDKQLTKITRPDGQTISYRYYAGGTLGAQDTPSGTTQYGYTQANGMGGLLNRITTPDGIDLRYSYDGFLPTSETWAGPIAGTVARSWNNHFQLTRLSLNGQGIDYQYDPDGLITQAGALVLTHDPANGLPTGTSQGVVSTAQSYNSFGELASQTARINGTPHYSVSYTRDALGRIASKTETLGGQTDNYAYSYDTAGRLTQVSKNGTVIGQYSYDANGNRLTAQGQTAQHDAQDRLINNSGAQYDYSANGELKRITAGTDITHFNYDVLGNLRQVTLPNGTAIDYLIDGSNRRIGKKVNGALVQGLLYQDQLKPIAELDGSGNTVARFVYATKTNVPDYIIKGNDSYRLITDHLGSPRLVIHAATGEIAQRIDYDEYGFVLLDTNPGFQPFGYAGGLMDQHTKLVRFGARDYDAKAGRWTAKDPIQFNGGDSNLYGYVFNDPVNWIDANGENPAAVAGAIIGGVCAAMSGGDFIDILSGAAEGALSFGAGLALGLANEARKQTGKSGCDKSNAGYADKALSSSASELAGNVASMRSSINNAQNRHYVARPDSMTKAQVGGAFGCLLGAISGALNN